MNHQSVQAVIIIKMQSVNEFGADMDIGMAAILTGQIGLLGLSKCTGGLANQRPFIKAL